MHILIAGDGKVGSTLARQLAAEKHDVTLIDSNQKVLNTSVEHLDVMAVHGNCAAMDVLLQAGVKNADLLIAVTNADEVNLLCCTTAHGINPDLHTIARIRNPEYAEQIYKMRDIFGLSMTINPEQQAAGEIARLLKYPGFLRRDTFAKSRAEIVELRIDANSKLRNVSLMDMPGIIKTRVLVCAVLRSGSAVAPGGDFVLLEGDRIFVTAPTENLTVMLKNLGVITRRAQKVTLCGGGRVSHYLASMLIKEGVDTTIIERDYQICHSLASILPKANVIHGDASDQMLMDNPDISACDALVTLTGMDELNMIIALYAKAKNIPQVITKLGHSENLSILDSLSLGSVVCPKELCCSTIIRYVRAVQNQTGAALSIHTIADGQAEAIEFPVDEDAPHTGTPLKDLKLRPNVLIASITHGSRTEVPSGNSVFLPGDALVVVTSGRGTLQQLSDIFA